MATIPARLAQTAKTSANWNEARSRSLALYRDFYRSAPEICALYALDVPPSIVRAKIRQKFESQKHVKDLAVVDMLLFKGRQEFQETMNAWKQVPHVMKWFAEEESAIYTALFVSNGELAMEISLASHQHRWQGKKVP